MRSFKKVHPLIFSVLIWAVGSAIIVYFMDDPRTLSEQLGGVSVTP